MQIYTAGDKFQFPQLHMHNSLNKFLKCVYSIHMLGITFGRVFSSLPRSLNAEQLSKILSKDPWIPRQFF